MKKTLQLLALSSLLSLPAMATVFIGYENNFIGNTEITLEGSSQDETKTFHPTGHILSIGIGDIDSYTFKYFMFINSEENYDSYNYGGMGFEFHPYFEISKKTHWYLDSAFTLADIYLQYNIVSSLGFRGGIGLSYLLLNKLEFTLGYKFDYISGDDEGSYESDISITNTSHSLYFGINFWFGNAHKEDKILKKIKPIEIDNRPKEIKEEVF